MTENNFILTLLLSLVLTAATYMLVPLIFRLKNGRMKIKEARKICIINSIVVALLWAIYHSTQDMNIPFTPSRVFNNVISTASEYKKSSDVKSCIEASIEILKISHENQYMTMLLTLDETEIKEIVSNLNKKLN